MTRSVLVTGASGFVGRDLIGRLAHAGWSVRAAARQPSTFPEMAGVEHAALPDLARTFDWRPLLAGMTHVVHLAGIAHADAAIDPGTYHAVNAEAVRSLAMAARSCGIRCVVLASSVRAQSGPVASHVLTEADRPQPTDPYGRSKLMAEHFLAEALSGSTTRWAALRPVLMYGRGVKGNLRALAALARRPIPLPFGALANRRSILGLPNFASAVAHVLSADQAHGRAWLVADPEPVTVGEIVAAVREAAGRGAWNVPIPVGLGRALAALAGRGEAWERLSGSLVVDTTALQSTGWRPVETTREGLGNWLRRDTGVPVWLRHDRRSAA